MDVGHLSETRPGRSAERSQAGRRGCSEYGGARTKERSARGTQGGHHWAHSEGHRAERDQAARPSQPPFFLLALGPAPGTSGRGRSSRYQPASPVAPSLRCPNRRSAQRAVHGKCTPPIGAGPQAGPVSSAVPALKHPAPLQHCACSAVGQGGTGDSRRAPCASGWRYGGRPAVAARRSCSCQGPRGLGPLVGHMQEPGEVHSRGRQARAATRCWLSNPRFRASWAKCCPSSWNCGYARESARDVAGWRMPLCLVRSRAGGHPAPGATLPVRVRTSSPFQSEGSDHPFVQTVDPSCSCTFGSGVVYLGTLTGLSKYRSLRAGPLPSALDACSFLGQAQEETWGQWLSSADR